MNPTHVSRLEPLNRDNYDTWKIHMEAMLIKNDEWDFVNGTNVKPETVEGDEANATAIRTWCKSDSKAKSDIILSIGASELKIIKGCETSRQVWVKLLNTYQSQGPARKATLLKQLMLHRMDEGGDVREHIARFFDAVDKLKDMEVEVNPDVLAIALLYSLPPSYESFRVAIESRDDLPSPDSLRTKIVEEFDAHRAGRTLASNAMFTNKSAQHKHKKFQNTDNSKTSQSKSQYRREIRCFKCRAIGHKSAQCSKKDTNRESAKQAESVALRVSESLQATASSHSRRWCLDSGATSHLCNDISRFSNIDSSRRGDLYLANSAVTDSVAEGTAEFEADVLGAIKSISLNHTLHVPDLRTNLVSVGKITDRGFRVHFDKNSASILDSSGNVKMVADRVDGLYYVRERNEYARSVLPEANISTSKVSWHRRLGHLNVSDLREALRKGTIRGMTLEELGDDSECDTCRKGKMCRTPFPRKSIRETCTLGLIHSDLCGPMRTESLGGAKYFMTLIDDRSRWCEVRFLKSKDEAFKAFVEFVALVENQTGYKVKCLQTDNGKEYLSGNFDNFLKSRGIRRRVTVPYNPEQNGVAERKNRSLIETARCLLSQSGLPSCFWAEALNAANFIRNRCPTKSLDGMTPHEAWIGNAPDVKNLQEFGCSVLCLDRKPGKGKFEPRCDEGVLVGFSDESKGYRVWLPNSRKVIVSRDVTFREISPPKVDNLTRSIFDDLNAAESDSREPGRGRDYIDVLHYRSSYGEEDPASSGIETESSEAETDNAEPNDANVEMRRGPGRPRIVRTGRPGRPRKEYRPAANIVEPIHFSNEAYLGEVPMRQAMSGDDVEEWKRAMIAELRSIINNRTWKVVDRPHDTRVIGSRIVLRNKYTSDGQLERRKARLVAQGFSQQPGVHFTETFAPVARLSSIRLIAALAARHRMTIKQFDVATAYLNGELRERIFMEPPTQLKSILRAITEEETEDVDFRLKAAKMLSELEEGDKVCLLKKSLYGLRQAGRQWHSRLNEALTKNGFTATNGDPCLYRKDQGEDITLIAVYVDDLIVASRSQKCISDISKKLGDCFEIRDIGPIDYCLGVKFKQSEDRITLSQRGYITDLLNRFNMNDARPVSTPICADTKLTKQSEDLEQDVPYRELVGSLTYLALTTRPDISFAASSLGQFNNCYGKSHWTAAKRVLRYLKGTIDLGLCYSKRPEPLTAYVDSDWGNCPDDRRSYSGYVFVLSGCPISWDARKQRTVALSSTEAEYMALTEGTKESIYWTSLLQELGFHDLTDVKVHIDNLGALKLAENPVFHARSKHIDIRHHFVREALRDKRVRIQHLSTNENVADMFTKGLTKLKLTNCIELAGMQIIVGE